MQNQYRPQGFRLLPPVVKNLLIINGLFFIATYAFEAAFRIDLADYLGLYYWGSDHFQPFQFVTYMFLHGGIDHIFFNMFALWMFGYALENIWGPKRFLTYYMVTGIGAGILQNVVLTIQLAGLQADAAAYSISNPSPDLFAAFVNEHFPLYFNQLSDFISSWRLHEGNLEMGQQSLNYIRELLDIRMGIPTVGASGGVFGILLAFGMLFPNSLIYLYFAIPIKAKWFVIFYGAMELYLGIGNNPTDNVAHFAHLGGMIFGFALIKYWNRKINKNNFQF